MTLPRKRVVVIYSLREARDRLKHYTDTIDRDDYFSFAILQIINNSVMTDELCGEVNEAVEELTRYGIPEQKAFSICSEVIDLIINQLTTFVPDYNDQRYSRQCHWDLKENNDVILTIDAQAFETPS